MKHKGKWGIGLAALLTGSLGLYPAISSAASNTIQIGTVGAITGPVSSALSGESYGLNAWVQYTNSKGGIDGQMINLTVGDSQSNPTTESEEFQTVYQSVKPVAFVGVGEFNIAAAVPFLVQNDVPVIGGDTPDAAWNSSPILYPQGTTSIGNIYGIAASVPKGAKFGFMYCNVAASCTDANTALFKDGLAKKAGLKPVYSSEMTLGAPNYLAQCLAAKKKGVRDLAVFADPTDELNLATSCSQEGFHPTYLATENPIAAGPGIASIKFIDVEGVLPWTAKTAAGLSFDNAMATYEPNQPISLAAMNGWSSGALFGLAAKSALNANAGQALTSAELISALNTLKNVTAGGLIPPVTFTAHGNQKPGSCWYESVLKDGNWIPGNSAKVLCAPKSISSLLNKYKLL